MVILMFFYIIARRWEVRRMVSRGQSVVEIAYLLACILIFLGSPEEHNARRINHST